MMVHCRDINFEPRVGDGIEGVVHRRAKDNKLQAYKVFPTTTRPSCPPPSQSGMTGEIFLTVEVSRVEKREEPQDEDWIHRSLLGIA